MRNLCWKWNFRANFGVLSLGFDVEALKPQGLTGRPNYFGVLNNLMTLIICESLREIGEMACVTSALSSRGQTLKHWQKVAEICYQLVHDRVSRGLALFLIWRNRLIYMALTLCEHGCKTVCDVKSGKDRCPSPARSWDKAYQISGCTSCFKHECKEVCDVKQGVDPYPLLAWSCNRWWPDFGNFYIL